MSRVYVLDRGHESLIKSPPASLTIYQKPEAERNPDWTHALTDGQNSGWLERLEGNICHILFWGNNDEQPILNALMAGGVNVIDSF